MVASQRRIVTTSAILIAAVFLGCTAALLLLDPLERLRQVQDRQLGMGTEDFVGVIEHYYKTFFEYPWDVSGQPIPDGKSVQPSWLQEVVVKKIAASELADRSFWDQVFIIQNGTTVYACFDPRSGKLQRQADSEGVLGCLSECWLCQSFTSE